MQHDAHKNCQAGPVVVQEGFEATLPVAVAGIPELPHEAPGRDQQAEVAPEPSGPTAP